MRYFYLYETRILLNFIANADDLLNPFTTLGLVFKKKEAHGRGV